MVLDKIEASSIVRWILLLPAAIVGGISSYLVLTQVLFGLSFVTGWGDGGLFFYPVMHLVTSGLLGYLFVAIGVAMAPAAKEVVAIVLFSIVALFFTPIAILLMVQADGLYELFEMGAIFAGVIGGGLYLYQYMLDRYLLFWE